MIRFRDHLEQKLKDKGFAKGFDKEFHAARLAIEIAQARESRKMTQSDLASRAHITQQQLSKVENAKACKVETLLKVCDALGMDLVLMPRKAKPAGTGKRASHGIAPNSSRRMVGKASAQPKRGAVKRAVRA